MANIFDYITWRGDLDFSQSPLNPVDYLIFSQMSYLPLDGIVPGPEEKETINLYLALKTLTEKLEEKNEFIPKPVLMFKEDPDFIKALYSSNRFRNCHLLGYVNQIDTKREIQFSALCIYTGDGSCSIVYRGTDASFVGWKEDFNMGFLEVIPAQIEAVKYLEKMAPLIQGSLRIGGHSKGGNLAVYAAAFCAKNIQARITDIFSYDAPGFHKKVIESESFAVIKEKIHSYVPQTSIVGMLLERGSSYTVIKSTGFGLLQHFLFLWEVTHNDLVHIDKVDSHSRFVDKTLKEWLSSLNNEQRENFIEAIYTILSASEAKSLFEFESTWLSSTGRIIKTLGNIDSSTRKLIMKTFTDLFRSAGRNINTLFISDKDEE